MGFKFNVIVTFDIKLEYISAIWLYFLKISALNSIREFILRVTSFKLNIVSCPNYPTPTIVPIINCLY